METKIEKIYDEKNSELRIIVPIEKKLWKEEQTKSFNNLSKKLKLKGYRAGKVPTEIAKKMILPNQIWEDAISRLLNVAVKDAAKHIDEKKDIILDSPTYSIEKVTNDHLEIIFIYPIYPDIKIKNWEKVNIKFKNPTDKEIKESVHNQINDLLSRGTILVPKENKEDKVERGDLIIFDFKGFLDGEAFEGGEAKKYELKIGSNTFIPGFEDQLIGKKLNWSGSINVKFPKDYYKEEFRNKDAQFEIKIHEIKSHQKQEMNNDFVASLNIKDVKNEEDLNKYLTDLSKREMIEKRRAEFMNEFLEKVIKENSIPTPRAIVLKELQALIKKFEENLKNQGFSKKDYFDVTGYNDNKVKSELTQEAEKSIKKSFIYTALSKDLKIKPTDDDFARQYQRIGKLYNIDPAMAAKMIKKEQIETPLINELLIDKIITTLNPDIKFEKEKVTFKLEDNSKNKTEKNKEEKENKKENNN